MRWVVPSGLGLALFLVSGATLRADRAEEVPAMSADSLASLVLGELYRDLQKHRDQPQYLRQVAAWYGRETIDRVLRDGDLDARRGAVVVLGHLADYRSSDALAAGLRDQDPMVRALCEQALWTVWFRAGTPQQNRKLRLVVEMREGRYYDVAVAFASQLIAEAPAYAEAYNQRAIALFQAGRYQAAIDDCVRALELNPAHFGAAAGMAQCYAALGRPDEAGDALRLALEIHPYSPSLQQSAAGTVAQRDRGL